ncbi:MAG: TRAP transporter substrate-binding protein DctP [Microbacteriaceae bacterium]
MIHTKKALATAAITAIAALSFTACSTGSENNPNPDNDKAVINMQFSSYLGPTTPMGKGISWFISEVESRSNGAIKIEAFWEGALLAGPDTLNGVSTGLADIGYMTTSYNPAELPLTQSLSVPFVTDNVPAIQETLWNLYQNYEPYQEEWNKNNVEVLTFMGVPPSVVATKDEVPNYDSLKGRTLRATGYTAAALQIAGANAITLPVSDVYESIQRGLIEGYSSMILDTIPSLSLQEVAPIITDTGLGIYTLNTFIMNADTYNALSDGHKKIFAEVSADYQKKFLEILAGVEDEACTIVLEAGGAIHTWPASETQKWKVAVGDELLNKWKDDARGRGVDPDGFYGQFIEKLQSSSTAYESGLSRCAAR